jgi:hypothetical protein
MEILEASGSRVVKLALADESQGPRFVAEKHVTGNVQLGDEVELLVDEPETEPRRIHGTAYVDPATVDENIARIAAVGTAQDFDEGAFTGPVLPEEHVHLPRQEIEVYPVEGQNPGESFDDGAHLHERDAIGIRHPSYLDV